MATTAQFQMRELGKPESANVHRWWGIIDGELPRVVKLMANRVWRCSCSHGRHGECKHIEFVKENTK